MKIVQAKAEYLDPTNMHAYAFMERIGRICYKSEDTITNESAVKFIKALFNNKHTAMLEHAHIIIKTTNGAVQNFQHVLRNISEHDGPNVDYFNITRNLDDSDNGNYISGSFRAFINLFEVYTDAELNGVLANVYPEIFHADYLVDSPRYEIMTRDEFKADVNTVYADNETLRDAIISKHLVHTVLFTCDRGVTHEFVRHRPASFAQESTRYCNYAKDKFGNEITVIEPCFFEIGTQPYQLWEKGCEEAEKAYFALLDAGCVAQQARDVLPNSVKTEIAITATESEWQHIVNLRLHGVTGAPHPQMKECMELAMPALAEYSENRLK